MSRECLFCGAVGTFTDEHVIPQWLLEYLALPEDDMLFQGVASTETGTLVEPPRIHSTFNFVEGRVCGDCNSGWMSSLEGTAKPILITLMEQSRHLQSLSASERTVVGKWAAKTAYLHTWAGPSKNPVQLAHLRALYGDAGAPANGVGVFGMQSEFKKPSGYIRTGLWPQLGTPQTEDGETPKAAYKVGLHFRHLYLLVASWPNPTSLLTRLRNLHLRVFPAGEGADPDYAVVGLAVPVSPIDRLVAFANGLAVSHSS
jgi:hypothetical protein